MRPSDSPEFFVAINHINKGRSRLFGLAEEAAKLFTQAQLIEGILPEDPAEYSEKVLQLLR